MLFTILTQFFPSALMTKIYYSDVVKVVQQIIRERWAEPIRPLSPSHSGTHSKHFSPRDRNAGTRVMFLTKEDTAPEIFTGGWSHRYQKGHTFNKYAGKLGICKKQKNLP